MVIKHLTEFVIGVIIVLLVAFSGYYLVTYPQPQYRVIDCTWSEISPDFSNAMREQCRKLRMEKVK